jgi:hypothetical protein
MARPRAPLLVPDDEGGPLRTHIGAVAAVLLLAGPPLALAHEGNPNYRSTVTAITPAVDGVTVEVLNFDDSLQIHNTSGERVVIEDYQGKPYARLLPDRTVEVNTNSEAYYLNDDRFADVQVPGGLGAKPRWKLVDRTGRFAWHDHRAHYMSPAVPKQVVDRDARTHIFDWKVPIAVGGERGQISGTLTWVPLPGACGLPTASIWASAGVMIVLCLIAFAVWTRRRGPREPAEAR